MHAAFSAHAADFRGGIQGVDGAKGLLVRAKLGDFSRNLPEKQGFRRYYYNLAFFHNVSAANYKDISAIVKRVSVTVVSVSISWLVIRGSWGRRKKHSKNYKVIFVIPAQAGIGSGNHSRSEPLLFFNKVLA
jgi:hypothetical protein